MTLVILLEFEGQKKLELVKQRACCHLQHSLVELLRQTLPGAARGHVEFQITQALALQMLQFHGSEHVNEHQLIAFMLSGVLTSRACLHSLVSVALSVGNAGLLSAASRADKLQLQWLLHCETVCGILSHTTGRTHVTCDTSRTPHPASCTLTPHPTSTSHRLLPIHTPHKPHSPISQTPHYTPHTPQLTSHVSHPPCHTPHNHTPLTTPQHRCPTKHRTAHPRSTHSHKQHL